MTNDPTKYAKDFAENTVDAAIPEEAISDEEEFEFNRDQPFVFTAPHRCTGCGQKTKNMTPENKKGWLIIPVSPGVMLYACVLCSTVHTNQEALFNTKVANVLIQEEEDKRIILPNNAVTPN